MSCKYDNHNNFSYLALGDSYTIGEGIDEKNRYPIILVRELKKQGVNHGLAIASAKKNADLIVKIEADTRKGAENSGVFVAYLNADVFVFDQKGKQLYQGKLVDVKGVQLDYNGASDDAYKKAIKPLDKKILREIQKVLFD